MIRINKTRANYLAKFEELIESWMTDCHALIRVRCTNKSAHFYLSTSLKILPTWNRALREALTYYRRIFFDRAAVTPA